MSKSTIIILVVLALFGFYGCNSYNGLVEKDTNVDGKWAEVQTQYQRRLDLIPNLVNTVKGSADFEKSTLTAVIEARSKATSIQLKADDLTPANMQKFQDAQNQLSGSLSRLMVAVEQYPNLKANANFQELQAQLEGTENRIAVSRKDFNDATQDYNVSVRRFPASIFASMFGFEKRTMFQAADAAQTAPTVKF